MSLHRADNDIWRTGNQELVTLQKHKWLAALLSILLMGALLLWVVSSQQKQTEAEVSFTANWSLAITELVIDETVASLEELAARGVDSCQPSHLELLRQAVFASGSIRELGVIGPQGQTLCTEIGSSFVGRDVLASAVTSNPDIMLDVVRIADTDERMLRVRRLMPRGVPGLALASRPPGRPRRGGPLRRIGARVRQRDDHGGLRCACGRGGSQRPQA